MTEKATKAPVPRGLKSEGRRLWEAVCTDFELEPYEASLAGMPDG